MRYNRLIAASVATVGATAGIAALALQRIPGSKLLPVHWNAAGIPDRFRTAAGALFMPPVLAAVIGVALSMIAQVEPMQRKMEQSAPLFRTAWAGLLAMMVLIEIVIAAAAFGWIIPAALPLAGTGLLLIAIGNALPKSRPGFFVGIRTPWTLTDPENWIATHRLGARTMMAGGGIIFAASLLPLAPQARATVVLCAVAIAVAPPLIYSFIFWRRAHPR